MDEWTTPYRLVPWAIIQSEAASQMETKTHRGSPYKVQQKQNIFTRTFLGIYGNNPIFDKITEMILLLFRNRSSIVSGIYRNNALDKITETEVDIP